MKKFYFLFIVFPLIFSGCFDLSDDEDIKSDINVKMWESVDSTQRVFKLLCYTDDVYSCVNYTIGTSIEKNNGVTTIKFKGIYAPSLCLTANGPATSTVTLGEATDSVINLLVNIEGAESIGKIRMTDTTFEADFSTLKELKFVYNELHRLPEKTIWGMVGYHAEATSALVQSFEDSLQYYGSTELLLGKGQYGYFEIDSTHAVVVPSNHGFNFASTFIYHYEGASSVLGRMMRNFNTLHGSKMQIILYTSKGEILKSYPY